MPDRILVTGGGGRLATALRKLDPRILSPGREELDFSDYANVESYCRGKSIGIIIHAGAMTNKFDRDVDEEYISDNIIGTANVALFCLRQGVRLVYISSDYVYPGERGGYTEHSVVSPVNRYAASKLGGELSAAIVPDSLIIRTSFYATLAFPKGCTDQVTSRIPVQRAAEAIYALARMDHVRGVINVGNAVGRSVFEIIRTEFNPAVEPCLRKDIRITYEIPRDASMDTTVFQNLIGASVPESKARTSCRICGATDLFRYLELGRTPLANSYLTQDGLAAPEFREELALQLCCNCGLSQLTKVVHPDLMFKNYLYVSSTTDTFRSHCAEMAATTTAIAASRPGDLVMDIASNDGCLLGKFRDLGMSILGVDPAENLAREANASGIRTLNAYWSMNLARDIAARFGTPVIITATNVFAHVDNLHDFVAAVDECMARKGIFVIECPYVVDFVEKNEFDTAYHEHLSYIGVTPLVTLMTMHGMVVFDVEYFPDLHGGTIRTYVCRRGDYPVRPRVGEFLERERTFAITRKDRYQEFAAHVLLNKRQLIELISHERAKGKRIWAYGASAKGNTLLNFFGISSTEVPVVIDDNPKKWGYFTPGGRMRIAGISELAGESVDYLLLLAWNFQKEIMRRCRAANYAGAFILPVPEPKIVHPTYNGDVQP